jgi:hypothetical protein
LLPNIFLRITGSSLLRRKSRARDFLLVPSRNRRKREKPYNRDNGKSVDRREGDGWVRKSGEAE